MGSQKSRRVNHFERIKISFQAKPFHVIFILICLIALILIYEFLPGVESLIGYLFVILIALAGICFGLKGGIVFSGLSILILMFHQKTLLQGQWYDPGLHKFYMNSIVYVLAGVIIGSFAELERDLKKRLQILADFDGLTNCYNYRRTIEILEQELSRAKRYKRPLTIMLIDIDFFKKINDSYGHLVGNNVLKSFAENLIVSLRDIDFVGRYGGEEFLVILPETSLADFPIVLERIKNKMQQMVVTSPYLKAPLSLAIKFSAGVAACPPEGANANQIISMVDSALYKAKRGGRDKAIVEKRMAIRFKPVEGLAISLIDFYAKKEYTDVFILDITPTGFKIKLDKKLETRQFLARIGIPGKQARQEVNCEICYQHKTTTGQFDCGFRFLDISADVQNKLSAAVIHSPSRVFHHSK
ncbi:MAG: GGDEF domain-containing protein [Candidatus Omnitrophica bacterium]|nr:GGDEF domain-containing protein [Candidatus Omnitrophota bacterium]